MQIYPKGSEMVKNNGDIVMIFHVGKKSATSDSKTPGGCMFSHSNTFADTKKKYLQDFNS